MRVSIFGPFLSARKTMSFDSEEMKKLVDSFEAHFYPVTDPLNPAYTETFR